MKKQPQIYYYDSVDSTNSKMKTLILAEELTEFSVVTASFQTGGRGQAGNSWESEADKNLLFSMLFFPAFIASESLFMLNSIVTVAIADVLKNYIEGVTIKWANDVYVADRKIAGILIENSIRQSSVDYSIVGIGLNVNQTAFMSEAPNPVSMKMITGKTYDTTLLLHEIINAIAMRYCECENAGYSKIRELYLSSLYRRTGYFPFRDNNGTFTARIEDIEDSGRLVLVDNKDFKRRYAFKEVIFEM
ncbi:MAG: biotin--[acetyl-CoA-carboxylase] ligase [Cytophagaceae bacterium]|jgi:BirA family biotin operon repressor/biotin-[acetyl-CoA-carboxylase] ligase|nr:biotin--[acetyl-CoA-carboxylase] ligase [Cytophagaceae bacterium]